MPSFLYAMPFGRKRVFLEETCLVARPPLPFDTLKRRLERRLRATGIKVIKVHDEEWSYIPVGGPMPVHTQSLTAFGAAANMIHPATGTAMLDDGCKSAICSCQGSPKVVKCCTVCKMWGNESQLGIKKNCNPKMTKFARKYPFSYHAAEIPGDCRNSHIVMIQVPRPSNINAGYSISRSLREAPGMASAIAQALQSQTSVSSMAEGVWNHLWPQEKRRQVSERRHKISFLSRELKDVRHKCLKF